MFCFRRISTCSVKANNSLLVTCKKQNAFYWRTSEWNMNSNVCEIRLSTEESKAQIKKKVISFFIILFYCIWLIRRTLLPFFLQIVMSRECDINWKFFFPLRYPNVHMAGLILPVNLITNKKLQVYLLLSLIINFPHLLFDNTGLHWDSNHKY